MSGWSLSLEAESITEHEETHVYSNEDMRLLKSAVIYGANASGKSNFLNAIETMKTLVLNSSKESNATEEIDVTPFLLSTQSENEPSMFEVIFIQNKVKYRYGFSVDKQQVHAEWLYCTKSKSKEKKLFARDKGSIKIPKNSVFLQEGKGIENKTRHNALFLSVVANFNGEISKEIQEWFEDLTFISGSRNGSIRYIAKLLENESQKNKVLKLVKAADFGIKDLFVEERNINLFPKEMRGTLLFSNEIVKADVLLSTRKKFDADKNEVGEEIFNVNELESEGTKKFLSLVGPIIDKLESGGVLVVDELDAKMHPLLTREIIRLFNSYDVNNSNAQLIYATHDVTNLSNRIFRRDQIWFVEKDNVGASSLYALAEYRDDENKKIRKDASYAKDYLLGKFGGVPEFRSWGLAMEDNNGEA